MAARLSAPTRSHNRLLEANQSDDRRAAVTASLVGCNVLLDGRATELRQTASSQEPSDESPPGAARSRQRRVIPTRSIGAPSVTAPSRSQRLDPPGCRALPPPTHPGLSFAARPHRCRRRQRAAVGTRPEAPRRAADLLAPPERPAKQRRQLVAALVRAQRDRTTGEHIAPISARAPARASANVKACSWCPSNVLPLSRERRSPSLRLGSLRQRRSSAAAAC